jgi:hypothetical protein
MSRVDKLDTSRIANRIPGPKTSSEDQLMPFENKGHHSLFSPVNSPPLSREPRSPRSPCDVAMLTRTEELSAPALLSVGDTPRLSWASNASRTACPEGQSIGELQNLSDQPPPRRVICQAKKSPRASPSSAVTCIQKCRRRLLTKYANCLTPLPHLHKSCVQIVRKFARTTLYRALARGVHPASPCVVRGRSAGRWRFRCGGEV